METRQTQERQTTQGIKDQENPNFSAFDTLGSLSNDPVFDPGRLGKRSDGTKIKNCMQNQKLKELKKHPWFQKIQILQTFLRS